MSRFGLSRPLAFDHAFFALELGNGPRENFRRALFRFAVVVLCLGATGIVLEPTSPDFFLDFVNLLAGPQKARSRMAIALQEIFPLRRSQGLDATTAAVGFAEFLIVVNGVLF